MLKLPKQSYTTEFKEQAVAQVNGGRSGGAVAKELGMSVCGKSVCRRRAP